jgi:YtcA family
MMYEVNWCGIYMPIWLVCLIFGELLSVVLGKLIQLMSRRTKLLTIDYASFALIFGFVFWSIFFGKR